MTSFLLPEKLICDNRRCPFPVGECDGTRDNCIYAYQNDGQAEICPMCHGFVTSDCETGECVL